MEEREENKICEDQRNSEKRRKEDGEEKGHEDGQMSKKKGWHMDRTQHLGGHEKGEGRA